MKLPWVSRTAYDLLIDERDRLREQNDTLTDQLVRIARRSEGMTEVPTERKRERVVIPSEIEKVIEGWSDPSIRREARKQVIQSYHRTGDWHEALAEIEAQEVEV